MKYIRTYEYDEFAGAKGCYLNVGDYVRVKHLYSFPFTKITSKSTRMDGINNKLCVYWVENGAVWYYGYELEKISEEEYLMHKDAKKYNL